MNNFYAEGDINSNAKGSGARANSGKIDLTLVPMLLLGGVTRVFMGGKFQLFVLGNLCVAVYVFNPCE